MKIHVYAQPYHHADAFIVADAEGLKAISAACEQALKTVTSAVEAMVEDGEGYFVFVTNLEERDPKWEQLPLPYTDTEITGKGGPMPIPELIGVPRYREIYARRAT